MFGGGSIGGVKRLWGLQGRADVGGGAGGVSEWNT